MTKEYHIPVLLDTSIEGLNIQPGGIYVDLTFGGGGHSREILKHLGREGRLIAFDQDADAWENAPEDDRFTLVKHNFRYLQHFLDYLGIEKVDGVLGDLGVSSHHFDSPERGFSFRFDGALDMRMGPGIELTAADIINGYSENQLFSIFKLYGEVPSCGKLVRAILAERNNKPFRSTADLRNLAQTVAPKKDVNKFLAQVFQALRIEVNREMEVLEEVLMQMPSVIKPEGRLVVIAYHSLEDRMVKNFIRSGNFAKSQADTDLYGNRDVPFKAVTRKAVQAGDEEVKENPRARSAKLRIAEKL
ncbi:16S rRNA (cytosine(1402)-N(4))-methyltransferase RsmH [Marinilabilia salmonicolor]|uniref:16S rRNA (cytosine(1402)-N(4))-methyltransferase RsmH n=1 Tax=Marinilabilia salmonicolor TaxID=989 RepID=UPI00029A3855|nr:16S rRNA (cytosine(1402)-N(4))-methyltransferase RsmH [Marinilabilia salmonicolor]